MKVLTEQIALKLASILGPKGVLIDPGDQERYLTDWSGKLHEPALAILLPKSTDQVSAVIGLAHELKIPLTTQGGRTGVTGATFPEKGLPSFILSLEKMNQIVEMDPLNLKISVEAGCILQDVQKAADAQGCFFPLSLGAEGSCQIGGVLATNAGGNTTIRYGNARDFVLGIEVVLPNGNVVSRMAGLRKDNRGFDLSQLFLGTEGTFGVIVKAVLKLQPKQVSCQTAFLNTENLENVFEVFSSMRRWFPEHLSAFELIPTDNLEFAIEKMQYQKLPFETVGEYCAIVEVSTGSAKIDLQLLFNECIEELFENEIVYDGVVAQNEQQTKDIWGLREALPQSTSKSLGLISFDFAVVPSRVIELVETLQTGIRDIAPSTKLLTYGHMGDGNIHVNICRDSLLDETLETALESKRIKEFCYSLIEQLDGTYSAEHGIGRLKRERFRNASTKEELSLMQQIKDAIDPENIMNPGAVFEL